MKKVCLFVVISAIWATNSNAMNTTADMVRNCEGVNIGTSDNYVLKCSKSDKITKLIETDKPMQRFFVADNDGDVRGTFLSQIPENSEYIYVNVASNLSDPRYENQTCYRFITEIDASRDGFYAVEVCEYERPDYYL